MSEEEGQKKIESLGGYDKLYRIKFEADYLAKLAYEGAKPLYGDPIPQHVADQIKFELHIMKTMGFPGYFLIVQDYINAARKKLGVGWDLDVVPPQVPPWLTAWVSRRWIQSSTTCCLSVS